MCVCWAKGVFPWNVAECPLASCGGQEGPEVQWMCGGRGPREAALEGTWPGARILSAPTGAPIGPCIGLPVSATVLDAFKPRYPESFTFETSEL